MGIVDDVRGAADWVAAALRGPGYRADFSPGSLWEIERFSVLAEQLTAEGVQVALQPCRDDRNGTA